MRCTSFLSMVTQLESHRYAKATFHEGVHRQAPGDSTPWRDVASPINRIKMWWLTPAAKGSMTAAWCMAIITGAYCFSIQQDTKETYLLNNVLMRALHDETLRANANEERVGELQEAVRKHVGKLEMKKSCKFVDSKNESVGAAAQGHINHEIELVRERMRADVVHERNQQLVNELHKVRLALAQVNKENIQLRGEVERLQKLSTRRM
uniref:Uncharacterized protein n=1 Tax=Trypanosoma vivax (strain Y486) TaxID=1055687 RepID=G0U3Q5_TRYVY|nr:conserved hypothetical protein [Trypanosoma vivax Y486]